MFVLSVPVSVLLPVVCCAAGDGSEVTADTIGCSGMIISDVVFAPHPAKRMMPDRTLSNNVFFALIFLLLSIWQISGFIENLM